jgi:hypothetical protein
MAPRSAVCVIAPVMLLLASSARADEGVHEKAAAAFQDGRRLIEQNNCEAAVTKLKESLQYEPSIGARLSIADCVEKEDPLYAWRMLKQASAQSLMNRDARLAETEQRAVALQSRIGVLVFQLPTTSDQPGFELVVDGDIVDRFLYRTGYAVAPGKHHVEAFWSGRRFSGNVSAEAGVQSSVKVDLNEDCSAASSSPVFAVPSDNDRGASRRALGVAIGAVGLAGVASGVVFGLLTLDKKRSIEGACGGSAGSCQAAPGSVDAEQESAKTTAALSTVGFAVGAVGVLSGAAIYLTAPSATGPRTGLRLSPRASGVAVEGSW